MVTDCESRVEVFLLYQIASCGMTQGQGPDKGRVEGVQLVFELFGLGDGVDSLFVGRIHWLR
jgi:hypothetical protein